MDKGVSPGHYWTWECIEAGYVYFSEELPSMQDTLRRAEERREYALLLKPATW